MELQISSNVVTIAGNIKSIGDFQAIKQGIGDVVATHNAIHLNIVDSLSITSSVIGYLNKLVLKDNIDLHMNVGNEQLLDLLDDLNLTTMFKAKRGLQ